jgi:uncharacterized protein YdcH (DUF465 family)
MPTLEEGLKEELLATNDDYRRLFKEHQSQERRLEALHRKTSFSQEDELEEKQVKLHKLHLKDQMEAILRAAQSSMVSA